MTWGTKSNVPFVFGSLSQAPSAKVSGYRTGARACSEPMGLDGWQQCISDDVAFSGSIPNAECFDGFG